MKINEVLNEDGVVPYSKTLIPGENIDQIRDILRDNCSEFLSNNLDFPLYRGTTTLDHRGAVVIDPKAGTRVSKDKPNHYTVMIDSSPAFSKFPKRSKSLIVTTDYNTAENFAGGFNGNLYCVIPFNGSLIGAVNEPDIWDVPLDMSVVGDDMELGDLPDILREMRMPETSLEDMIKYGNTPQFAKDFAEFYPDAKIAPEQFIPYMINTIFTPQSLGFKLHNTSDIKVNTMPNTECWTDGKCVLILAKNYEAIVGGL